MAAQPPPTGQPQGSSAGDPELATNDEVKEYCHEGEGENTEHLNSMDLHDIKTELEKDAEEAEVSIIMSLGVSLLNFTLCLQSRQKV